MTTLIYLNWRYRLWFHEEANEYFNKKESEIMISIIKMYNDVSLKHSKHRLHHVFSVLTVQYADPYFRVKSSFAFCFAAYLFSPSWTNSSEYLFSKRNTFYHPPTINYCWLIQGIPSCSLGRLFIVRGMVNI